MPVRKIITIDEELCNGCGECVDACHEGAIAMIDGKARLVSETYCDGLGDCLSECPMGAITITEREAAPYDQQAVDKHLAQRHTDQLPMAAASHGHGVGAMPQAGGCPGAAVRCLEPRAAPLPAGPGYQSARASQLRNWPVQLHLVPVQAPWLEGADLVLAADCVPCAHPDFHGSLLAGRTLIIACPKLDDTSAYLEKLTAIFQFNDIRSIAVPYMEVPCCRGLVVLVEKALAASGREVPLSLIRIGIQGEIQETATA